MKVERTLENVKNCLCLECPSYTKGCKKKLNKNIDPNSNKECYVLNTPQIIKRKSFGYELKGYKITDFRDKAKIRYIANKKK